MAILADFPYPVEVLKDPRWSIGMDEQGAGASLTFHVGANVPGGLGDPSHVIPFLEFIGGTEETVVVGGVATTRVVPLVHPYLPGMVAVRVRAEGVGKPTTAAPYSTDSRITVDFAVPSYSFGGDAPYSSRRRRIGSSSITLPGQALAVSGVKLNHDVAKHVPEIIYSWTFFNLPTQSDDLFVTLAGKLNSSTFLGRAPKTVRFDGVEDEETTLITFQKAYTVTIALAWRPISWNAVLLPTGVWDEPVNISDGTGIYDVADLNLLLQ